MSSWSYRPELDGLRTPALYAVIAFHANVPFLEGGFIALDVFFVLSGFLITNVILHEIRTTGTFDVGGFYARRVRRLLPAALFVILATCVVWVLVESLPNRIDVVRDAQAALVYLANWNYIAEANDYFAADDARSPFLHFWSLSVEEQYYLLFPLLVLGAGKFANRTRALLAMAGVVIVLSVAAQLYWASIDVNRAYYGTDTRVYQILVGVALALLFREWSRLRNLQPSRAVAATGVLAFAALCVLATSWIDLTISHRGLIATVLTMLVVGAMAVDPRGGLARLLGRPNVSYLGKISYGVYLWHMPVTIVVDQYLQTSPWVIAVVVAGVSTGLAALMYQVFEAPIRRTPALNPFQWPVVVVGFATSVLVAAFVVGPVLRVDRQPVTAADAATQQEGTQGLTQLVSDEALLRKLRSSVPDGLDYQAIANNKGVADISCRPDDPSACTLVEGDGDGPHVLLVGDSQARMLGEPFIRFAREKGFRLSASIVASCAWQGDLRQTTGSFQEACDRARDDFYTETVPTMDPDVVVLAGAARTDEEFWGDRLEDVGTGRTGPHGQLLHDTTVRTVRRLEKSGARVVMVHSVVGTDGYRTRGWDPLDCLARASTLADCAVIQPSTLPLVDSVYDTLALESDAVSTVDLNPVVCPTSPVCLPVRNGFPVWRDDNHVATRTLLRLREQIWERVTAAAGPALPE